MPGEDGFDYCASAFDASACADDPGPRKRGARRAGKPRGADEQRGVISTSVQPAGTGAGLAVAKLLERFRKDDLEYEFLSPALEIEETPPSPVKRVLIWVIF